MDFALVIQSLAVYALPVLFAITVHEAAHGYAARYFGDNTAWKMGRVTLNPASHIDPIGTIVLPLVMYLASAGGMLFGYAKPVPVRFGNLRNPKRDMIWVALAGPASNLVQALLWGALYYSMQALGVNEVFFYGMCKAGVSMNIGLCVLNLFPLPPLDGGRILTGLLPMRQAIAFSRIEPYGFFIVLGLIYLRILDSLWMQPLSALMHFFLNLVLSPLAALAR
jgi:Zn-dependent protease